MSQIPKIIHYCWFGNAEMPEMAKACIQTWKKHLPDYEFRFWNNEHLALFDNNPYVQQAFQAKKYAFVTDYVRLYVLYHYGGIYMDTDVECKKNLDEFLDLEFFTSFEDYYDSIKPVTALMGACKHNSIIADLLACYNNKPFVDADGSFDLTPNTILITDYFRSQFNLLPPYNSEEFYYLTERQVIFPAYYFCKDIGSKTYAVHFFSGSWLSPTEKIWNSAIYQLKSILRFIIGNTLYLRLKEKVALLK